VFGAIWRVAFALANDDLLTNARFNGYRQAITRPLNRYIGGRYPITRPALNDGQRNCFPCSGTCGRRGCSFSAQRYLRGYAFAARIQGYLTGKIGRYRHRDLSRSLFRRA